MIENKCLVIPKLSCITGENKHGPRKSPEDIEEGAQLSCETADS